MTSFLNSKKGRRSAIAGLSLIAVCGLAVGGTQAAFNSSASQATTVTTKSGVNLTVDSGKTVDDSPAFAGMVGGESRTADHIISNTDSGSGALVGTVHITGSLASYATVNVMLEGVGVVQVVDGQVINGPTLTSGEGMAEQTIVQISSDPDASGRSMNISIDWVLTAV